VRSRARVVHVAGRGAVSGFGAGIATLGERVWAGHSAVQPRARTAAFPAPTAVAAEVPAGWLPPGVVPAEIPRRLACAAAREALAEAGSPDPGGIGLVLASTKADLSGVMGAGDGLGCPARLAALLAADLSLGGVRAVVSTACASGLVALSLAARRIARGEDERLLVVGVDALCAFVLAGFGSLNALDPGPCRPFDIGRRGISLGEAAGALLLSARASDSIGVAIAGHGGANDACDALLPDHGGQGLALAAGRALARAGLSTADVDVIHVHGTGTLANDRSEALGLVQLFGGRTAPAFGTKAQTGHTLGAAGLIETVLAIEALRRAVVPPNVGLEEPDVEPRLDLVREPRPLGRARCALKLAGGFGGIQAALVLQA
jgi:3-oxoacyl-[acyl-carrier-protein] synthase III